MSCSIVHGYASSVMKIEIEEKPLTRAVAGLSYKIFSNLLKVSSKIVWCRRLGASDNNIQWENDGREASYNKILTSCQALYEISDKLKC